MIKGLVTVVITTYMRHPEMVVRSIKSILNQTYKKLEIIVVDDSPKDYDLRKEVKQRIESLNDNRITYLQNENNIGACASRNRGISNSNGEFFMYVDDDDELIDCCIEKRLKKFENSDIGLVYSDCYVLDESTGKKHRTNQDKHTGMVFDKLILKNFIYAFPTMRAECLKKCGGFNESLLAAQDYELWLRICQKYKVDYVDEPLSIVHIHSGERITTAPSKKIQGLEIINEIYKDYLAENKYVMHIKLMRISELYMAIGEIKKCLELLLKGIIIRPFDIINNLRTLKHVLSNWIIYKRNL